MDKKQNKKRKFYVKKTRKANEITLVRSNVIRDKEKENNNTMLKQTIKKKT